MKWTVGICVALVILALIFGESEDKPRNGERNSTGQVTAQLSPIGTPSTTEKCEYNVMKVFTRRTAGDPQFLGSSASEGGIYVVVQWSTKNISQKPIGMFSQPSGSLIDSNGVEYDEDIDATSSFATEVEGDQKIVSDLNPGIKTTQFSVYEVSEELWNSGAWQFEIYDGEKVRYGLK